MAKQACHLKLGTLAGTVVIKRTRGENGQFNTYQRIEAKQLFKTKTKKKGILMVNAKKQAVMFVLNLIKAGMEVNEIEQLMFTGELEINAETIDFYRAEHKEVGSGVPIKEAVEARKAADRQKQIDKLQSQQTG
jgi:hypothetical protein